jgi:AcrR family transcriptional regulator
MPGSSARRRGRPRSRARDRELLAAAQELLAEVGYDRLTVDAVASRCGAGRTTVYRRWPGKEALVADAVAALRWDQRVPDTGDLRSDLLALATAWSSDDAKRDAVVSGLVTAMAQDADLRVRVEEVIGAPRAAAFREIVDRAAQRGDITRRANMEMIGALFPAMALHRLAVRALPVDRDFVTSVIDEVILPLLVRRAGDGTDGAASDDGHA